LQPEHITTPGTPHLLRESKESTVSPATTLGRKGGAMNRKPRLGILCLFLISILASVGCSQDGPVNPDDTDSPGPGTYTFVMIHLEAGYKARIEDNLIIELPPEYLAMDFGWQAYLFETAQDLVQKADDHGFHLTLAFNPQWAEYFLLDGARADTVRQWQEREHEIAFHHHAYSPPDWNGYSNDPIALGDSLYLGDVDAGLDFVRSLATPASVTTAMIAGLPMDMPQSYDDTAEDLIFTGGNQYDSFEKYGELRSLRPTKVLNSGGGTVVRVAHRQLTMTSTAIPIQEALDIFKAEYSNMEHDEIYGIVFHCFEYLEDAAAYDEWFEFIENSGDSVRTVSEVVSDYEYDIPFE